MVTMTGMTTPYGQAGNDDDHYSTGMLVSKTLPLPGATIPFIIIQPMVFFHMPPSDTASHISIILSECKTHTQGRYSGGILYLFTWCLSLYNV